MFIALFIALLHIGCIECSESTEISATSTPNATISLTPHNSTASSHEENIAIVPVKISKEEECEDYCPSCVGKIFLTILITILVWSPICYVLSYKWIKFREEIEANAAYEAIRRRTFEMMQQQHGPVQYDSFIGCPVDLFNDRHGPPQIDPSNPPPPTTIAVAIQRKISAMVEGARGGGAPH